MGRIVVTEFVSVDGVAEGPGGDNNFKYGAWTFEYDRGAEGNQFKLDETTNSDALLLGRNTYEGFAAAWPERDDAFAKKFNTMPKYVISSTLQDPEWNNTTVIGGDPVDGAKQARDRHEGDVTVHGSLTLAQALLYADLVDQLNLMVFPVVLGYGKRLFADTSDKRPLKLADSKIVGDGVAILVYQAARD
jgi:dihydrofolate reductase